MNLYVGNLSPDITEDDLREAFKSFGEVASVNVIKDKFSGSSRGFAFVEMPVKAEAQAAIGGLNEKNLKGQSLIVSEARPRRAARGGGGGGGGGRGPSRGGGGGGGGGGNRRYSW